MNTPASIGSATESSIGSSVSYGNSGAAGSGVPFNPASVSLGQSASYCSASSVAAVAGKAGIGAVITALGAKVASTIIVILSIMILTIIIVPAATLLASAPQDRTVISTPVQQGQSPRQQQQETQQPEMLQPEPVPNPEPPVLDTPQPIVTPEQTPEPTPIPTIEQSITITYNGMDDVSNFYWTYFHITVKNSSESDVYLFKSTKRDRGSVNGQSRGFEVYFHSDFALDEFKLGAGESADTIVFVLKGSMDLAGISHFEEITFRLDVHSSPSRSRDSLLYTTDLLVINP